MSKQVKKSFAMFDVKADFVSLVSKAANKRRFLIVKSEDKEGFAEVQSYGPILKTDKDSHYVTGIVYEPMTSDTDDNYMTAEEIEKAEKYFREKSAKIDLQHSNEACESVSVVKSWINPVDCSIGGQEVKKGTWLLTVEIKDDDIFEKIEKGDFTGYSMGGWGQYSEVDVNLGEENSVGKSENNTERGLVSKIANMFGYEVVKKGEFLDNFKISSKNSNFWAAFDALRCVLCRWDSNKQDYVYCTDENKIRESLSDFVGICTQILTTDTIDASVIKAEKKLNNVTKEESEMDEKKIAGMIATAVSDAVPKAVEKAMKKFNGEDELPKNTPSAEEVVEKALSQLSPVVEEAVEKEMSKYSRVRGKSTALDDEEDTPIEKEDKGGLFDNLFE